MSSRLFDLEKAHYYEIWAAPDNTEWSLFSPEQQTKKTYKLVTHDAYGYPMIRLACLKGSYEEAKLLYNDLMISIDDFGFLEKKE